MNVGQSIRLDCTLEVGALERYLDSAIHNLLRVQRDGLRLFFMRFAGAREPQTTRIARVE